jgi:lipid A 4'-phosphatase
MTRLRRYADVALACAVSAAVTLWPAGDLWIARELYRIGPGFAAASGWVGLIYTGVARMWIAAPLFAALLVLGYTRHGAFWRLRRRALWYLLAALLLGPGLLVNTLLKNHWGRARPVHLAEFGGQAAFTPALVPSRECARNCSFPSGHAAAAFFPIAGYWLTRRRRWLVLGSGFGLLVGSTRMARGPHFLSEGLFSGLTVHFSCRLLGAAFGPDSAGETGQPGAKLAVQSAAKLATSLATSLATPPATPPAAQPAVQAPALPGAADTGVAERRRTI